MDNHPVLTINKINLFVYSIFFLCAPGFCFAAQQNLVENRPNIILILSDNQSASLLGTYGNKDIKTPNIDSLAREGIVFTNAFATSGVCSPTRATLLTGLLPSQTGVHNALPSNLERFGVNEWSAISEFDTLPEMLSEAGYFTGLIGKYHLGTHDRAQLDFDKWVTFPSGHTKSFYDVEVIDNEKRYTVSEHLTDFWTKRAIQFLEDRDNKKPFFLFLSYNGPYMLPPTVTKQPKNRYADWYSKYIPQFPQEPVHPFLKNWAMLNNSSSQMQADATHAWAAIEALNNKTAIINAASETSMVDDGVGKVMDALRRLNLEDNTLVIYTSDQGSLYGQHGLWGNTSWAFPFPTYNGHLRIPLILRHLGRIPAGIQSEKMINQFDVFPTLIDYFALEKDSEHNYPGNSFLPLLHGKTIQKEDIVYFEFITVRGVQTPQWKYIKRFPEGPHELYHLTSDPEERHNVYGEVSNKQITYELDALLTKFFSEHASPEFDLWRGGTAKARLIEDYGQNNIFKERFPDWNPPYVKKH